MGALNTDLLDWLKAQGSEAQGQINLFTTGGVKAILQMPDGTTQDITEGVLRHGRENLVMFERIAEALGQASSAGLKRSPTEG